MSPAARWTPAWCEDAARHPAKRLASFSVERGADGFARGCSLALEHRTRIGRTAA